MAKSKSRKNEPPKRVLVRPDLEHEDSGAEPPDIRQWPRGFRPTLNEFGKPLGDYSRANQGWPRWCSRQIEQAAAVVVVWTGRYGQQAAAARDGSGEGRGSAFESAVIFQEIYDLRAGNSKFLPVLLSHDDADNDIPAPLRLSGKVFRVYEAGVFDKLVARLSEFVLPRKSVVSAPPAMFVSMQI